ncbi:hypothetical protein JTB14_034918 [Gonioctena quinquepunctata]|nr:hypothetical protein JTB14_034918 [Gonioctena quinquepunctata]
MYLPVNMKRTLNKKQEVIIKTSTKTHLERDDLPLSRRLDIFFGRSIHLLKNVRTRCSFQGLPTHVKEKVRIFSGVQEEPQRKRKSRESGRCGDCPRGKDYYARSTATCTASDARLLHEQDEYMRSQQGIPNDVPAGQFRAASICLSRNAAGIRKEALTSRWVFSQK